MVPNDIVFNGTIILELIHSLSNDSLAPYLQHHHHQKWILILFSYGVFGGGDRVGGGYLELEVLILVFGLVNWEETSNHKKFEFVGIESVRVEREKTF